MSNNELVTVDGNFELVAEFECPYCMDVVDLFKIDNLTDDGWIHHHLMPRDGSQWSDVGPINKEVECPRCEKSFIAGTATY